MDYYTEKPDIQKIFKNFRCTVDGKYCTYIKQRFRL